MPLFIISIVIQVICVMHAIKSGRGQSWIWLIIIAPGIGSLVYFLMNILPDLGSSRTAYQAKEIVKDTLDPHRELKAAQIALEETPSVNNRRRLGYAMMVFNLYDEAEEQLQACLTGGFQNEPNVLIALAEIALETGNPENCMGYLDRVQEHNNDFQSQRGHMLYARALDQCGRTEEAISSYGSLLGYATGDEVRYCLAELLNRAGHREQAMEMVQEIETRFERGPKYYKKLNKEWRNKARLLK